PSWKQGLLAAMMSTTRLGSFDLIYDPYNSEQILLGQIATRSNRLYFDTWASFPARSSRKNPQPPVRELDLRDYRTEPPVNTDLSMDCTARIKVKARNDGLAAAPFEIAAEMAMKSVAVDGVPAEVLQADAMRVNLTRSGNNLFLVVPKE